MSLRIGQGFDIHQLVLQRKLIIGGVEIPHNYGLLGHSDGDVLLHSLIDALIGACGFGDIGVFFPDNDNQYKDISSRILLKKIHQQLQNKCAYSINNIDSTIIIQAPRLRDYIDDMRNNIANDLGIDSKLVNIKAKTSESVGSVGRKESVIAESIVLINLN
jgi:2-C-methyl-D-erythritol 2,4-cyclodiphosphate synthase